MAQHDILVFTDVDVRVTPTWFGNIVSALVGSAPRSVVTGRVLPTETEKPAGFAPSTKADENPVVYAGRIGEDVLYSNNAAMLRSVINDVGNFDIRLGLGTPFPAAEDCDYGFRLREAGYRIIYVPEAMLYHRAWRNERDYLPLRWSYGYGQGAYYAKYLSLTDRYMLWRMIPHVKNHALVFAWRVRRQRHLAYGDAGYLLGVLRSRSVVADAAQEIVIH
jgi:GT2 family glycosyltransferase